MNYYCYNPDSNRYAAIGFPVEDNIAAVYYTDDPLADRWTPRVPHGFEDNPVREGDFPTIMNYGQLPAASQRAWEALRPLIGYCCEALPIIHPSRRPHFIIHVMETLDCLDAERSELTRNMGRVNRVFRYAFKPELLPGKHIFKLPLESGADLIVDEDFRRTVERNKLKGLLFEPLPMVE